MRKRCLSSALALALVFTLLPGMASAAGATSALARAAGFTDAAANAYYAEPVAWR